MKNLLKVFRQFLLTTTGKIALCAFLLPLLAGVALFCVARINSGAMTFCGSPDCISVFYDVFRIPINVMLASIPVCGLAVAIYRMSVAEKEMQGSMDFRRLEVHLKLSGELSRRTSLFFARAEGYESPIKIDDSKAFRLIFPDSRLGRYDFAAQRYNGLQHAMRLIDCVDKFCEEIGSIFNHNKEANLDRLLEDFVVQFYDICPRLGFYSPINAKFPHNLHTKFLCEKRTFFEQISGWSRDAKLVKSYLREVLFPFVSEVSSQPPEFVLESESGAEVEEKIQYELEEFLKFLDKVEPDIADALRKHQDLPNQQERATQIVSEIIGRYQRGPNTEKVITSIVWIAFRKERVNAV